MSEISVPFLPEHQAVDKAQGKAPGYNPTPEDRGVIKLVERLYSKSKNHRKKYDQKWLDFYKMFRGKQWKEVRPSYRSSEVINLVFQTIQSMVPILTDSRPKLEFLPTVPKEFELAEILTKVAENDWAHNNWLATLTEILFDAHFYGIGYGYCGFDQKDNLGLGNICFESWDPFYVFPDPEARDINDRRGRYLCYAEPVSIDKLKREYKDKASYITADIIDLASGDKSQLDQITYKSPVDNRVATEGEGPYDGITKDQCLKITTYLKDDEVIEEEKISKDEQGQEIKEYVQRLKYPNGRKIVTAGSVLLEDGPMEFEDGKIPAARMVNYTLPREFFGIGEVEPIEGPQKTFNKLVAFTLDVMNLMGNPVWVVGSTANIDTDNLVNKPGLIIETDDPNAVRREPGVQLQGFVMQLMGQYKSFIDGISGQTDLSRGVEPTNVSAASAIEGLQQAQQTRLRLKSRNIDAFLNDFGRLYLSRVFQFYSVPRIVRVTGNDAVDKYFQFHVEVLDMPDGSKKRIAHVTDPNTLTSQSHEITGDFDVRVSTGSALPFSKETKSTQNMKLFEMGIIDDEELLKNLDYPNYEAVLMRVRQKKEMEQMQQMQMQASQAPPPGPPPAA